MNDTAVQNLLISELERQQNTIMLIPSENYVSTDVLTAIGSVLTNKYSEGYAGKRYYQGNIHIDAIEKLAIQRAQELFAVPYANVQPYSGSPANSAIYFALLEAGDTIMGLKLTGGGHLTHGHPDITFSGKYFNPVQFDVRPDGYIDMEAAAKQAQECRPKLITVGTTAYPRNIDWKAWQEIADSVGAYLHADISHIAGLVAAGQLESPVPFADVIMTTTHKTLRGPRGAVILVTEKGISRNPSLPDLIDRAVFPGLQGGPHDNTTAGIAIALHEAQQEDFKEYGKRIIDNAHALADALTAHGFALVTGGTDNHLMVIDLRKKNLTGNVVAEALDIAGLVVNRNSVPFDPNPPFYPSGIRLGTPAVTTRGMSSEEMKQIAQYITDVTEHVQKYQLPTDRAARKEYMKQFRAKMKKSTYLTDVNGEVQKLCKRFPIYPSISYR